MHKTQVQPFFNFLTRKDVTVMSNNSTHGTVARIDMSKINPLSPKAQMLKELAEKMKDPTIELYLIRPGIDGAYSGRPTLAELADKEESL